MNDRNRHTLFRHQIDRCTFRAQRVLLSAFCFFVVFGGIVTGATPASSEQLITYKQQCQETDADDSFQLRELQIGETTEDFVVASPNKLKLKSGADYRVIETQSWGKVYVFGSAMAGGGNAAVCGCKSGCTPSCNSPDDDGAIVTCMGGCYKNGDPCISCTFKELDIVLPSNPSPN